ncbi:MAG: DUF1906 domain-containing protein, partial [Acidimicrobiales bacterium]
MLMKAGDKVKQSGRRYRPTRGVLLLAAAATLSAVGVVGSSTAGAAAAAVHAHAITWHTLRYGSERFSVPASWPVHDIATEPATCVRFDGHAVFEGASGAGADCPAHIAGVSEAVQVQPLGQLASTEFGGEFAPTTLNGQEALVSINDQVTHRVVVAFPRTDVLATISYRNDRALAMHVLSSFALAPARTLPTSARGTSSLALQAPSDAGKPAGTASANTQSGSKAAIRSVGPVTFTGQGFDTCDAPSESDMATWKRDSPYGAVGVYIGGANAACTNVTASWVDDEADGGWHVFPIYVGRQSPCADQSGMLSIDASNASSEGKYAADNAVSEAQSFAMGRGDPIYYDMEAWDTGNSSCDSAVVQFVRAWTLELHQQGYVSGFYSSIDGGMKEIEAMRGQPGVPDVLYFAYWDGVATTSSSSIPSNDWTGHQRIKQYWGNVTQTFGGVSINIDQDYLDAPTVADPRPTLAGVSQTTATVGT